MRNEALQEKEALFQTITKSKDEALQSKEALVTRCCRRLQSQRERPCVSQNTRKMLEMGMHKDIVIGAIGSQLWHSVTLLL